MPNIISKLDFNNIVIAIGASTGGTEAILDILKEFPKDMPPIVVTQHMPEVFTNLYAQRANSKCKLTVKEAQHGDFLSRGSVYIAPGGDFHMKVLKTGENYQISLTKGDKVSGHRPSVDVLFSSVARSAKNNSIGIILTGMGQDGANGLLEIKNNGGYTIGQNKESCVVYGMPMVAKEKGAVIIESDLNNIKTLVMNYLKNNL